MRRPLGYALLIFSCLVFAAMPVIPFLELSTPDKARWAGVAFIVAELSWWLAIALLGKEVIDFCRRYWLKITSRYKSTGSLQQVEPVAKD